MLSGTENTGVSAPQQKQCQMKRRKKRADVIRLRPDRAESVTGPSDCEAPVSAEGTFDIDAAGSDIIKKEYPFTVPQKRTDPAEGPDYVCR